MPSLVFADMASLRAALDSGLVPATMQAQGLAWARDEQGQVWIEPSAKLGNAERDKLVAAGVVQKRNKPDAVGEARAAACWGEILATQASGEPVPPLGEVLFVSEGDEGFLRLSGELIRLGCEEQRLAFYVDPQGPRLNLCRVVDPPYYAVLRALDPDDPLRAYAPTRLGGRVMVELGHRHPTADRYAAEPGQLVLVSGGLQAWRRVPDGPWIDLHEVAGVTLPPARDFEATLPSKRLQIDLQLVRAPAQRAATLWVVRERAIEQMETLVRTLPDVVVARLRFAAVTLESGETLVVLRARRSEQQPPALELVAEAYTQVAQLPDLHVPIARTIDPPLRPAKLRELLLREPDRVVWLAPQGEPGRRGQAFVRESLPERAFAPLAEWVEYLVGRSADTLVPWVRSTMFDLDEFVSMQLEWDERPTREARDDDDERRRGRKRAAPAARELPSSVEVARVEPTIETVASPLQVNVLAPVDLPRSAAELRCVALEQQMCELGTPLDDPERIPLWVEIGGVQALLRRGRDSGLAWARALWEPSPSLDAVAIAAAWASAEARMLDYADPDALFGIVDVVPEDLDESMIRALAARVVLEQLRITEQLRTAAAGAGQAAAPRVEGERLAALQRFFASHGNQLDLRCAWLVRSALARLAGDDRLALFQTRDAIMAALREGMGLSRNVPAFIRTWGNEGDAGDLGRLSEELVRLRDEFLATKRRRSTHEHSSNPEDATRAYVRMTFGWGLARLGRPELARNELDAARLLLGVRIDDTGGNPLHRAVFVTYLARIEQSLEGLPASTPLPAGPGGPIVLRDALSHFDRFKFDRLASLSKILDPRQSVDAFERWNRREDEPPASLALLTRQAELAQHFDRTLAGLGEFGPQRRVRDLGEVLGFLEALPDTLAVPLLRRAIEQVAALPLDDQPRLLRDAVLLAAYYDRPELLDDVLGRIETNHAALSETTPIAYAELLTRCAPALRRSGLEDRIARLLTQLEARIGEQNDLAHVTARLHLAAGHAALGQPERVQPAFAVAHALLPDLNPGDHQVLLREIAVALSRSTPGQAIAGARALIQRLVDTTDSMSTNSHFCLAVIQLMEAVVLSLASEDLALSEWARGWIEEDEHLLHRRIHRDLARAG